MKTGTERSLELLARLLGSRCLYSRAGDAPIAGIITGLATGLALAQAQESGSDWCSLAQESIWRTNVCFSLI